jgi:hypothetical protein
MSLEGERARGARGLIRWLVERLTSCQDSVCASALRPGRTGTSTGSGTPTHDCAALAQCCPSPPMHAVSGCQTIARVDDDSICAEELSSYRAANYCP